MASTLDSIGNEQKSILTSFFQDGIFMMPIDQTVDGRQGGLNMLRKEIAPSRAAAIERYINDCCSIYGTAPSVQDIANHLGLSKTTTLYHLKRMKEEGRIESKGNRGYYTIAQLADRSTTIAPILGRVACGTPLYAAENIEDYIRLPEALFGKGDFFFLRAKGSSMIGAGIDNGDLVLIRHQNTADPGQIVVAFDADKEEATLKRYFPEPEKGRVRLHPENPECDEIYIPVERFRIQGVAVNAIKKL